MSSSLQDRGSCLLTRGRCRRYEAFNSSLSAVVSGWTLLETSLGSIARLRDLEAEVKPEDGSPEIQEPAPTWPDHGEIEIQDMTASHRYAYSLYCLTDSLTDQPSKLAQVLLLFKTSI